jgi:hypothetical protein
MKTSPRGTAERHNMLEKLNDHSLARRGQTDSGLRTRLRDTIFRLPLRQWGQVA